MELLTPKMIADFIADDSIVVIEADTEYSFLFKFCGVRYFAYSPQSKILVAICDRLS